MPTSATPHKPATKWDTWAQSIKWDYCGWADCQVCVLMAVLIATRSHKGPIVLGFRDSPHSLMSLAFCIHLHMYNHHCHITVWTVGILYHISLIIPIILNARHGSDSLIRSVWLTRAWNNHARLIKSDPLGPLALQPLWRRWLTLYRMVTTDSSYQPNTIPHVKLEETNCGFFELCSWETDWIFQSR